MEKFIKENWFKVIISLILILLSGFFVKYESWKPADSFGMIMILSIYVTELFFFFMVINKYKYVGDYHILNTINKNVKKKMNIQ